MVELTRRCFLHGLGAVVVGAACRTTSPPLARPLAPTRRLAIDMHNHVYPTGTEPHPHEAPQRDDGPGPSLELADALRRSGFTAVCASYVLDFARNDAPGDAAKNFSAWLDAMDRQLERGHLRRALVGADLEAARDHGPPTIIQTIEGAMFIEGQLERLDEVYRRGLRHLQLLHDRDDKIAPLGDTNTGDGHLGGLTKAGADVIAACNRLGILVDLAHGSHDTVVASLEVATRPLVVSHTSLAERPAANPRMLEMMRPRLITTEHAKVVAAAGGLVGVWTHMAESLPDFVGSIAAMVSAIGIDHVGIGTDSDLLSDRDGHGTTRIWRRAGSSASFVDDVVAEMTRQGFHADDIDKVLGGNYARVFARATA